jgi:hypothetical protein
MLCRVQTFANAIGTPVTPPERAHVLRIMSTVIFWVIMCSSIVPCALLCTWPCCSLRADTCTLRWQVTMHFGEAVVVQEGETAQQLSNRVRASVQSLMDRKQGRRNRSYLQALDERFGLLRRVEALLGAATKQQKLQ